MTQTTLQAHRVETTLDDDGRLVLSHLPFPPGQAVEVIVLPQIAVAAPPTYPLRGKPVIYHDYDPFGAAVPDEDWDALR